MAQIQECIEDILDSMKRAVEWLCNVPVCLCEGFDVYSWSKTAVAFVSFVLMGFYASRFIDFHFSSREMMHAATSVTSLLEEVNAASKGYDGLHKKMDDLSVLNIKAAANSKDIKTVELNSESMSKNDCDPERDRLTEENPECDICPECLETCEGECNKLRRGQELRVSNTCRVADKYELRKVGGDLRCKLVSPRAGISEHTCDCDDSNAAKQTYSKPKAQSRVTFAQKHICYEEPSSSKHVRPKYITSNDKTRVRHRESKRPYSCVDADEIPVQPVPRGRLLIRDEYFSPDTSSSNLPDFESVDPCRTRSRRKRCVCYEISSYYETLEGTSK